MRKLLHMVLVLALVAPAAGAQTSRKSLESQRSRLQKDIELLNRKLAENSRSSEKAMADITLVRSKIAKREALIGECDKTLKFLDDSISACRRDISLLQDRYDTLSLYYGKLIRGAYKNRDGRQWYMYILSSSSVGQAYRRLGYFRSLSAQMNAQAERIQQTSAALEAEKDRLEAMRKESDEVRRQEVHERTRLREEEAEAARLQDRLQKDKKQYQQQLKDKNRQIESLNKKIADLIRQEQKSGTGSSAKSGSKGKTVSTEVDAKLSGEFASNKGRLPWPVDGVVTERFGKHMHPVYTNVELPQNNGVTLTVRRGARVQAVYNGTVTQIFVLPGYNQCVLVSHGSYYTLYTKLKTVSVKSGSKVSTGDQIGTVDTIGGEDLFHFELWNGSDPQNPELWLKH